MLLTYKTTKFNVADCPSIAHAVDMRAKMRPRDVAVERLSELGDAWWPVTAPELSDDLHVIARGYIGMGLQPGDTIGIMGATSYAWTILDLGAQAAQLVLVPIYDTDSYEQIQWIVRDSQCKLIVCDTSAQARLLKPLLTENDCLQHILSLDDSGLEYIQQAGQDIPESQLMLRMEAVNQDDLCSIVYTSGTTGIPKGVELTHKNFVLPVSSIHGPWKPLINLPSSRILLFLPVAHVLARIINYTMICGHGRVGHVPSIANLMTDISSFKPTAILVVPRVLEKIYNAADAKSGRGLKHRIFVWAAHVGQRWALANETKEGPTLWQNFTLRIARALVLNKITRLLGGQLKNFTCGGAPLAPRIALFFEGLGISVTQGYGATETGGPLTMSFLDSNKHDTVGKPLPGNEVRIGDNDEIQARGISVMRGYYNDPEATAEAFTKDGWYRTGDQGSIDDQGRLSVTGRLKEIIVTAGGKNVTPSLLEERLKGHPLVSQVVVVGDGKPFVSGLVTIDREMLPLWLKNHNLPVMDVTRAIKETVVLDALSKALKRTNSAVSRAESIRKIKVLTTEFTEENGLMTPSLKVKRHEVAKRYATAIDELYNGDHPSHVTPAP
ncbi:MAG: long-chain fatty acid--CoA ligase [Actinomycetaceae bacterium]|nr:long-chain fatty acid--CoA ligase [Actinomycetaceae bacterium]